MRIIFQRIKNFTKKIIHFVELAMAGLWKIFSLFIFCFSISKVRCANFVKVKQFECVTSELTKDYFYPNYTCSLVRNRKTQTIGFYAVLRKEMPKFYVIFFFLCDNNQIFYSLVRRFSLLQEQTRVGLSRSVENTIFWILHGNRIFF